MIPKLSLLLPDIRSAYNVGSLFRTADGLGIDHIFLCGYTASPPHKEIAKTALGAENMVPWSKHEQTEKLLLDLREQGICIVALEKTEAAISLSDFCPTAPLCLIVGNEVQGITPEISALADAVVAIPMQGGKESFNVAVAASIAMWEIRRKLQVKS